MDGIAGTILTDAIDASPPAAPRLMDLTHCLSKPRKRQKKKHQDFCKKTNKYYSSISDDGEAGSWAAHRKPCPGVRFNFDLEPTLV